MESTSPLSSEQRRSDLVSRDYHLGLLAQVTEFEHRAKSAEARLEAEMTRAFNAETELAAMREIKGNVLLLRRELDALRSSLTWKIGRFVMLPIRLARRILGR